MTSPTVYTINRDLTNCIDYKSWPHQLHTKCFVTSPRVSLARSLLHTVVHIINTRGTRYYNDFFFFFFWFSDLPQRDNQVTVIEKSNCMPGSANNDTRTPQKNLFCRFTHGVKWRYAGGGLTLSSVLPRCIFILYDVRAVGEECGR